MPKRSRGSDGQGRTFCIGCECGNTADDPCDTFEGCGSVVDWGETVPAKGHSYEMVDGVMKCSGCDEALNGDSDGKTYIDGVLAEGWVDDIY